MHYGLTIEVVSVKNLTGIKDMNDCDKHSLKNTRHILRYHVRSIHSDSLILHQIMFSDSGLTDARTLSTNAERYSGVILLHIS